MDWVPCDREAAGNNCFPVMRAERVAFRDIRCLSSRSRQWRPGGTIPIEPRYYRVVVDVPVWRRVPFADPQTWSRQHRGSRFFWNPMTTGKFQCQVAAV